MLDYAGARLISSQPAPSMVKRDLAVKTKCVFQPVDDEEDGYRILITRYYPRGIKAEKIYQWVSALSPSPNLLFSFKDGKNDWDTFKRRFLAELRTSYDSLEAIHTLHALSKEHDVT